MKEGTALLVIDVQVGIFDGMEPHDFRGVLDRITRLLQEARAANVPIVYIQHDGGPGHRLEPGTRGWPIHPAIAPATGEPVVRKRASDSFFETELHQRLRQLGITHLVVGGCMTEYCVDTTCRRAITMGYDVTLVGDAHTTANATGLKASQIIAHHNELLDGFSAGGHGITVTPAGEIAFAKPWRLFRLLFLVLYLLFLFHFVVK